MSHSVLHTKVSEVKASILVTLSIFFGLAAIFSWQAEQHALSNMKVRKDGGSDTSAYETHSSSFSSVSPPNTSYEIHGIIHKSFFSSSKVLFRVDDCLMSMSIAGQPAVLPSSPHCDYAAPIPINLPNNGGSREYPFSARIHNHGGPVVFKLENSTLSPLSWALLCFSLLLFSFSICALFLREQLNDLGISIVTIAFTMRIIWYLLTPFGSMSHDYGGHLEYLHWTLQHWTIPNAQDGWEFFQPPFYYWLCASLHRASEIMDVGSTVDHTGYGLSIFMSLCNLILSCKIILLCTRGFNRSIVHLAISFAAFLPSTVYTSVTINNDTLATLLGTLLTYLTLLWWLEPRRGIWWGIVITLPLALATKFSLLPLAAVIFTFSLSRVWALKDIRWGLRYLALVCSTLMFLLPYLFTRWKDTSQVKLIENASQLPAALRVETKPAHFLTFSIVRLIQVPFLDPMNDISRRAYPWESLFKTAFTDEANLGMLGKDERVYLYLCAFGILLGAARGLFFSSTSFHTPVVLITGVFFASAAVARWLYPFGSTANFRYFMPLVPLIAVLFTWGIALREHNVSRPYREVIAGITFLWIVSCVKLLSFIQSLF